MAAAGRALHVARVDADRRPLATARVRRATRTAAAALALPLARPVALLLAVPLAATLALPLAAPAVAQEATGAAAEARLDFPTALAEMSAAIEADPEAPGPRLARAALHMKMQRPALALADLGAVLETDPAHLPALRARVEIWDAQQAWNRARDDLDAGLAAAPGDPDLLALRGAVNARAGLTEAALADYTAALAAAPGNAEIASARDALLGAGDRRRARDVVFGPEAVMSEAYLVEIGAPEAPNTLHVVHAVPHLADELTALDPALIDAAVDAAALKVVHLFTYTGDEASIWGSLALICAGPGGYAATHAALSDTPGREALDRARTGDLAPLDRILNAAYSVAGIDEGLVASCALDRLHATRYLADWQAHRDAGAFRGVNLLDRAPAWVLNGASVGPADLATRLIAMAPTPDTTPVAATDPAQTAGPDDITPPAPDSTNMAATTADAPAAAEPQTPPAQEPDPAAVAETPVAATDPAPPGDTDPDTTADAPAAAEPQTPPAQEPDPAAVAEAPVAATDPAPPGDTDPDTTADATAAAASQTPPAQEPDPAAVARFPERPEPVSDARVPVELRGVYAPSLADCLGYLAAIEDPDRIDAVLPAINPLDGPPLGTILVTSRRAYLFNALDTECAIRAGGSAATGWEGTFACASPLAPDAAPVLMISPAPADGTAPRVTATFAAAAPAVLRQCRALGQLGNAFAPLWDGDDTSCSVGVSVEKGRFAFSIDPEGDLVLRLAPDAIPAEAGRTSLRAAIDGGAVGEAPGRWDGTGWQMSLGPFEAAAESLGWGMFLDLRTTTDGFEARLPLFGSSAAMETLADCTVAGE